MCLKDCDRSAPCGGLAGNWDPRYDSKAACCSQRMPWNEECYKRTSCVVTIKGMYVLLINGLEVCTRTKKDDTIESNTTARFYFYSNMPLLSLLHHRYYDSLCHKFN